VLIKAAANAEWRTVEGAPKAVNQIIWSTSSPNVLFLGSADQTLGPGPQTYFGIYKSVDRGATWALKFGTTSPKAMALHPQNAEVLYAATGLGTMKTTDGGESWTNVNTKGRYAVALDPTSPDRVFVRYDTYPRIQRSTNGGATWTSHDLFGCCLYGNSYRPDISVASDGQILTVSEAGSDRSTDGGDTWQRMVPTASVTDVEVLEKSSAVGVTGSSYNFGFGRTTDAGATWIPVGQDLQRLRVLDLVRDPSADTGFLAGTEAGLFRSIDGGESWQPVHVDRPAAIYAVATDPLQKDTLYAGFEGGAFKSSDGGASWVTLAGLKHASVTKLLTVPGAVFAGSYEEGLHKSMDGGATWIRITGLHSDDGWPSDTRTYSIFGMSGSPVSTREMRVGVSNWPFTSTDGGSTWTRGAYVEQGAYGLYPVSFSQSPADPLIVYLTSRVPLDNAWASTDRGVSWTRRSVFADSCCSTTIQVNPWEPSTVLLGTSTRLLRSVDGASTWVDITNGIPDPYINSIFYDTPSPHIIVGADGGPFRSTDQGGSWVAIGDGFPAGAVAQALVRSTADPSRLVCGTTTSGVLVLDRSHAIGRGDIDENGTLDVIDVFALIEVLFSDRPPSGILDVDADGIANVVDVFYLINHLFAGGPPPPGSGTEGR
jgi:photosystem II stability/assembly factor-like uncharacterized protein